MVIGESVAEGSIDVLFAGYAAKISEEVDAMVKRFEERFLGGNTLEGSTEAPQAPQLPPDKAEEVLLTFYHQEYLYCRPMDGC